MLQRLKEKSLTISKKKGITQFFISLGFLVIFLSALTVLAQTSPKSEPTSPITKTAKGSTVLLASADQEVSEKLREDGIKLISDKTNQGKNENEKDKSKEEGPKKDNYEIIEEKSTENQTLKENKNSPNKVIDKDGKGNEHDYFTTSIIDKEVVSTENYRFKIYQKAHDFKVKKEAVSVNRQVPGPFKGEVKLKKGDNLIQVVVTYVDQDRITFTVTKEYHVFYEEKLMIETNLTDLTEVKKAQLDFKASAYLGNETAELTIFFNGKKVEATQKNDHRVTLKEGKNTIELLAKAAGQKREESYDVTYIKSKTDPAEDSSTTGSSEEPNETDKKAPIITTSIQDGETVNGGSFGFSVSATDYSGEIYLSPEDAESYFSVELNGKLMDYDWSNSNQTTYSAELQAGVNRIVIKAIDIIDSTAHQTLMELTVSSTAKEDGEVIGQATISVEATTVGLGTLIPPTIVEVKEGQKVSHIVTELLESNNYDYEMMGSLDSNFYLSRIISAEPNIWPSGLPTVDPEIEELLLENRYKYDSESFFLNSLGEFDLSNGSGWMYSINDIYPNVGMSDKVLNNKDVVRLRFTLMYGADINGAGGFNGSGGENFGDW